MTETSHRLGLPLLAAGQAQKEVTHNEALLLADIACFPVVQGAPLNAVPPNPQPGRCWIIGSTPTGIWLNKANHIAAWTMGGWRFLTPVEGMHVFDLSSKKWIQFDGSAWLVGEFNASSFRVDGDQVVGVRQAAIANPAGGTSVDAEARVAISAILSAMRTHGLIAV